MYKSFVFGEINALHFVYFVSVTGLSHCGQRSSSAGMAATRLHNGVYGVDRSAVLVIGPHGESRREITVPPQTSSFSPEEIDLPSSPSHFSICTKCCIQFYETI